MAVKNKLLLRSAFEDVDGRRSQAGSASLEPGEARRLLAAVGGKRAYAWFLFALLSGAGKARSPRCHGTTELDHKWVTISSSYSE